ncbi:unnamed protein product [Lathyrus sativus]|nr:unnamed protein product [Lathyrus sativus]
MVLSIIFVFDYGLSFAIVTATVSQVFLFHGKEILLMWRKTRVALKEQAGDLHTRIMKKNCAQVPDWWFMTNLVLMIILALVCCEGFDKKLQLP